MRFLLSTISASLLTLSSSVSAEALVLPHKATIITAQESFAVNPENYYLNLPEGIIFDLDQQRDEDHATHNGDLYLNGSEGSFTMILNGGKFFADYNSAMDYFFELQQKQQELGVVRNLATGEYGRLMPKGHWAITTNDLVFELIKDSPEITDTLNFKITHNNNDTTPLVLESLTLAPKVTVSSDDSLKNGGALSITPIYVESNDNLEDGRIAQDAIYKKYSQAEPVIMYATEPAVTNASRFEEYADIALNSILNFTRLGSLAISYTTFDAKRHPTANPGRVTHVSGIPFGLTPYDQVKLTLGSKVDSFNGLTAYIADKGVTCQTPTSLISNATARLINGNFEWDFSQNNNAQLQILLQNQWEVCVGIADETKFGAYQTVKDISLNLNINFDHENARESRKTLGKITMLRIYK